MRIKTMLAFLLVLALASVASAQTKISSVVHCGKPEVQHMIQVGDRPNHAFVIGQSKCSYTKAWEIAGLQSKEGMGTDFGEMTGNNSRVRGYYVETFANGDKANYRYQGTGSLKDGAFQTGSVKWELFGGTGKLKGIKGKGSCKGKGGTDGSVDWECEGEYQLP